MEISSGSQRDNHSEVSKDRRDEYLRMVEADEALERWTHWEIDSDTYKDHDDEK